MDLTFVRAAFVCGACMYTARALGVEAAAFPLLILAMASPMRGRGALAQVAIQLLSHLVSIACAFLLQMQVGTGTLHSTGGAHATFLFGCLILVSLQFTPLRHPPAMASGGAVLCGIDPLASVACVGITGAVLAAELVLARAWRVRI